MGSVSLMSAKLEAPQGRHWTSQRLPELLQNHPQRAPVASSFSASSTQLPPLSSHLLVSSIKPPSNFLPPASLPQLSSLASAQLPLLPKPSCFPQFTPSLILSASSFRPALPSLRSQLPHSSRFFPATPFLHPISSSQGAPSIGRFILAASSQLSPPSLLVPASSFSIFSLVVSWPSTSKLSLPVRSRAWTMCPGSKSSIVIFLGSRAQVTCQCFI